MMPNRSSIVVREYALQYYRDPILAYWVLTGRADWPVREPFDSLASRASDEALGASGARRGQLQGAELAFLWLDEDQQQERKLARWRAEDMMNGASR